MISYNDYYKYLGDEVIIKTTEKSTYIKLGIVGMKGIIKKISGTSVGVSFDGLYNDKSDSGVFWFSFSELKKVKKGITKMIEGFNNVAYVQHEKWGKVYAFAIFDEELKKLEEYDSKLVVVNAVDEDNRVMGTLTSVVSYDEFKSNPSNKNIKITAQVVGVVDTRDYDHRVVEEERLAKLEERRQELRAKLDIEIERRKTIEFYEKMAKEYSDDATLLDMVNELKELETK